jgi:hypothetical protein
MFTVVTVARDIAVIAMVELACADTIQHFVVPKISLARRMVSNEFETNPPTTSTADKIMTRNNEIDFFIPGDHQNVANVKEFKVIVVDIIRTLKKHAVI